MGDSDFRRHSSSLGQGNGIEEEFAQPVSLPTGVSSPARRHARLVAPLNLKQDNNLKINASKFNDYVNNMM
jgi:hypothetical protein